MVFQGEHHEGTDLGGPIIRRGAVVDYECGPKEYARSPTRSEQPQNPPAPPYTGTFYSEELDASWRIVTRDLELVLRQWGVADQPLWSLVEDAFSFRGGTDPRLRFRRDADGSITGFSLSSDQIMDMEFVRTRDCDARR